MHAAVHLLRFAVFGALEPRHHAGLLARCAHDRKGDQVREREFLRTARAPEGGVEFDAARLERPDCERAKAGRRRDRQAGFHVSDERAGGTAERRDPRLEGERPRRAGGGGWLGCAGRRLLNISMQNETARAGTGDAPQIDAAALCKALGLWARDARSIGLPRAGRSWCGRCGQRRSARRNGGLRGGRGTLDDAERRADGDRLACADADFEQPARGRGRDFHIDFVGRDLDQRFALLNEIAGLLAPLDDRAFGHRFAQFRQRDVDRLGNPGWFRRSAVAG